MALYPDFVFPHGSDPVPSGVTTSVTGLLVPRIVRVPAIRHEPSPAGVMPAETNVALGKCSASKKSALLRCASRCSVPVLMDATPISALSVAVRRSSSVTLNEPAMSLKVPRTVENTMCLTAKPMVECVGSMVQLVVGVAMAVMGSLGVMRTGRNG